MSTPQTSTRQPHKMPTLLPLCVQGVPRESTLTNSPRWLHALVGKRHTAHQAKASSIRAAKDKQSLIVASEAMMTSGALPHDGGPKKYEKKRSHLELSLASGTVSRESFGRMMAKLPNGMIKAIPTGTGPNRYEWGVETSEHTFDKNDYQSPAAAELAKDPRVAGYFPDGGGAPKGYERFPSVAYHPDAPLSKTQRAIFSYLCKKKLFVQTGKIWKSGRIWKITQAQIALDTGYSVDAVRRALRAMAAEWTDRNGTKSKGLGLFKIVGHPGHWEVNGQPVTSKVDGAIWRQEGPNEYIGVANFVETDKERYDQVMEKIRASRQEWAKIMDRIYAETRLDALERGGQLKTFHAECRRRMQDARVPQSLIDQAVPPLLT